MANLTVYRAHLARRDPYTTNTALARRLRLHVLGPQPGGTARHAGGSRGASTRHPRCAPRAPSDNVKNALRAAPSARAHRSPWRPLLLKPAGGGPARGARKAPPARLPRGARPRQHGERREHRVRGDRRTRGGRDGVRAARAGGRSGGAPTGSPSRSGSTGSGCPSRGCARSAPASGSTGRAASLQQQRRGGGSCARSTPAKAREAQRGSEEPREVCWPARRLWRARAGHGGCWAGHRSIPRESGGERDGDFQGLAGQLAEQQAG